MTELEQGDWVVPSRMAAVIPSTSGIGNGRSIARIGAIMAMGGELDGRRYLSQETIVEAGTEQSFHEDRVLGWCRYGLGFGLDSDYFPRRRRRRCTGAATADRWRRWTRRRA